MNKIENSKQLFFKDKEHYLNFRKQWKTYYNSKDHIKYIEPGECGNKKRIRYSTLDIEFHLFYNLLRGKSIEEMFIFSDKKNTKATIRNALWYLDRYIKNGEFYKNPLQTIFQDTINEEMLQKMLPELNRLYKLYF